MRNYNFEEFDETYADIQHFIKKLVDQLKSSEMIGPILQNSTDLKVQILVFNIVPEDFFYDDEEDNDDHVLFMKKDDLRYELNSTDKEFLQDLKIRF